MTTTYSVFDGYLARPIIAYSFSIRGDRTVICPECRDEAPDDLLRATPLRNRDELDDADYCEVCERDL